MQSIRQRVLSILEGKAPERLPWLGDLAYWHFAMSKKGTLEERYRGFDGILNLHRDLKTGFYLQGYFPFMPEYRNCEVTEVQRTVGGYEDFGAIYRGAKVIKRENNDDIIRTVSTPIGTISERWPYAKESFTWAPKEYFIKRKQDLEVFKYWLENTSYGPDYDQAFMVKEKVGDIGFTLCYTRRSPLIRLMIFYIGVTNTINFMMDYPRLFNEVMKVLEYKTDEATELAMDSPSEFIMIPENLSSDVVGKNFYEKYLRPYEEKWNKKIKSRGKYSFIHMDGYLKGLLKEVSTAGFSVIESLTPEPVGDLKVSQFRDYVKTDTVCWGGIPGALFTPSISEDNFEKFVIDVIKIMTAEPKYVLGIADQIPPDGIIERVKKVSDLVEKYGKYENDI
jgi:uroporphyrinogen-III decarboxylase